MNEWIEWKWTPERPYPETLGTYVSVRTRCTDWDSYPQSVEWWGGESNQGNWHPDAEDAQIIEYCVVPNPNPKH